MLGDVKDSMSLQVFSILGTNLLLVSTDYLALMSLLWILSDECIYIEHHILEGVMGIYLDLWVIVGEHVSKCDLVSSI